MFSLLQRIECIEGKMIEVMNRVRRVGVDTILHGLQISHLLNTSVLLSCFCREGRSAYYNHQRRERKSRGFVKIVAQAIAAI